MSTKITKSERFELRLDKDTLVKIDEWRKKQSGLPSRSEAVRNLIDISLGKSEQAQLFHLARFNLLIAALNNNKEGRLQNAYIYAWSEGVYPACHDNDQGLHRPFIDNFDISREMVVQIEQHLFACWRKDEIPSFYELEGTFQLHDDKAWDRENLIRTLRYLYLSGCFDTGFWKKILERMNHPSEAGNLTREFSLGEIYLN